MQSIRRAQLSLYIYERNICVGNGVGGERGEENRSIHDWAGRFVVQ